MSDNQEIDDEKTGEEVSYSGFRWGLIGCDHPAAVSYVHGIEFAQQELAGFSAQDERVLEGDMRHMRYAQFGSPVAEGPKLVLHETRVERDWRALLNNKHIQGFIVCAHPLEQLDIAQRIAAANKHCFLHPPFAFTAGRATRIISAFSRSRGKLLAGHALPGVPLYEHLMKTMTTNLDKLEMLNIEVRVPWKETQDAAAMRASRGVFFNTALDFVHMLACCGIVHSVKTCTSARRYDLLQRASFKVGLCGTDAEIVFDMGAYRDSSNPTTYYQAKYPDTLYHYDGNLVKRSTPGDTQKLEIESTDVNSVYGFALASAVDFYRSRKEFNTFLSPHTGRRALNILEAVERSAVTGRIEYLA